MKDYVFVLILLAGLLFVQSMNIEGLDIAYQCTPGKNAAASTNWGCDVMTEEDAGQINESHACYPSDASSCLGAKYFEFTRFRDDAGEAEKKCKNECQLQTEHPDLVKQCQTGQNGVDVRLGAMTPIECIMKQQRANKRTCATNRTP